MDYFLGLIALFILLSPIYKYAFKELVTFYSVFIGVIFATLITVIYVYIDLTGFFGNLLEFSYLISLSVLAQRVLLDKQVATVANRVKKEKNLNKDSMCDAFKQFKGFEGIVTVNNIYYIIFVWGEYKLELHEYKTLLTRDAKSIKMEL